MEITENSVKQSEELDRHWVQKLFPPQFTLHDLLEGRFKRSEERHATSPLNLPSDRTETRSQIYSKVLRKVQEEEEKTRRSNLAKRISRDGQYKGAVENEDSCKTLNLDCNGSDSKGEKCIWNENDICNLRVALTELQSDRWRLREQLRSSQELLKSEREERKRLQELLEKSEEQLSCSRKETARHDLVVKALKMEVCQKDIQLQKLAKQSQEKVNETGVLRAELRRTRDDHRQIKQENSDLAWELQRVKEQQKMEGLRQAEEARLEYQAAIERLQKEVQEAHTELRAEKESHGHSLAALELLRRHFSNL